MKNTIFQLLFFVSLFFVSSLYSQNFIIKENSSLYSSTFTIWGYFKNGMNVICYQENGLLYLKEIDPVTAKHKQVYDSIVDYTNPNVIPYVKDTNLCYVSLKSYNVLGWPIPEVYLYRKNVTQHKKDSVFLGELKNPSYSVKRFHDTEVVEIFHTDVNSNLRTLSFFIISGNSILKTVSFTDYNGSSGLDYDYYFDNSHLFIWHNNHNNFNFRFYNYSLLSAKVDSSSFDFKNDGLGTVISADLTKVNSNIGLVCHYTNQKDSIFIFDLGNKGISFDLKNAYPIEKEYKFIRQSGGKDYLVTGNNSGIHTHINYIDSNFKLVTKLELTKTLDKQNNLFCNSFFENADTMYFIGFSGHSLYYSYLAKVYPAPIGIIQSQGTEITGSVYPNPCKDVLYVKAANVPRELIFTDMVGKRFAKKQSGSGFDVSDLANGIYSVSYFVDEKLFVLKVCVEN